MQDNLCSICQKESASRRCEKCDIFLCERCTKKAILLEVSQMVLGVPTSSLKPGKRTKYLCPDCFSCYEPTTEDQL